MKTVISSALPSVAAIFGALALSCGALPAAAADTGDVPQIAVQYDDLNLSNPTDARELYNRIAEAADKACKSYPVDGRSLVVHELVHACVRNAVTNAVIKIDRPELAAIYNAKNHHPLPNRVAIAQAR